MYHSKLWYMSYKPSLSFAKHGTNIYTIPSQQKQDFTVKSSGMQLLYSRKFLKGLIFENFESSQVFLKIFFQNQ